MFVKKLPTISGTWYINAEYDDYFGVTSLVESVNFLCHDSPFDKLLIVPNGYGGLQEILYENTENSTSEYAMDFGWSDEVYRTIDFGTEPQEVSQEFFDWLTANATEVTE